MHLVPSSETARVNQLLAGALPATHVSPELVEVYIGPPHTNATSVDPSPDEAIWLHHALVGALVCDQLAPEFVDVKIGPNHIAATTLVPSDEQAIEYGEPCGRLA